MYLRDFAVDETAIRCPEPIEYLMVQREVVFARAEMLEIQRRIHPHFVDIDFHLERSI